MIQTEDLNITGVNPLTAPKFIKAEYPITDKASETVFKFRGFQAIGHSRSLFNPPC